MEIDNITTFECPRCKDFKDTNFCDIWCPLCNYKRYVDWVTYVTRRSTYVSGVYISEVDEEGKVQVRKL